MTINDVFDFEVMPAIIGWRDKFSTFNGMVFGMTDTEESLRESVMLLRSTLENTTENWKSVQLFVVPLPGQSPEQIVLNVHDIVSRLEDDPASCAECFSIKAGDLFF